MTAYLGWIASGAMLLWYVADMLYSQRRRSALVSLVTMLLLSEDIYESHRRQLRDWIAGAEDRPGRTLPFRARDVIEGAATTLGRDGSLLLANGFVLDAKRNPVPEIALAAAAELRTEIARLQAVAQAQDETIATLRDGNRGLLAHLHAHDTTIAALKLKADDYDILARALQQHPDLADALYDRLGTQAST
jgi:hypothetical protein